MSDATIAALIAAVPIGVPLLIAAIVNAILTLRAGWRVEKVEVKLDTNTAKTDAVAAHLVQVEKQTDGMKGELVAAIKEAATATGRAEGVAAATAVSDETTAAVRLSRVEEALAQLAADRKRP